MKMRNLTVPALLFLFGISSLFLVNERNDLIEENWHLLRKLNDMSSEKIVLERYADRTIREGFNAEYYRGKLDEDRVDSLSLMYSAYLKEYSKTGDIEKLDKANTVFYLIAEGDLRAELKPNAE